VLADTNFDKALEITMRCGSSIRDKEGRKLKALMEQANQAVTGRAMDFNTQ